MYGLVDCNNFFVSCERVFNPGLNGRPVVVLSNNDGCVISRSNEVKQLGVRMGIPFYQIADLVKQEKIAVYSTNFTLYGDMSGRVMSTLLEWVPDIEIYSVDEAFLHLKGLTVDLSYFGRELVRNVTKNTGIPVSLGIAPTKTLAKIANHFAKKYPGYQQVCRIDTEEKRIKALQATEIGDVWGIGRRFEKTLKAGDIRTAFDLTQKSRSWIRRTMSVTGERTWLELWGKACIERDDAGNEKQQICTSRSFGEPVTTYEALKESIVGLASLCIGKLREQGSVTKAVYLFIQTNRFQEERYMPSRLIPLTFETADTSEIIQACLLGLNQIYKPGMIYKRAGVILTDLQQEEDVQPDLFDPVDRAKQRRLAKALDGIAQKNGRESIRLAIQGNGFRPHIRQKSLSQRYTTNLDDIIEIKV